MDSGDEREMVVGDVAVQRGTNHVSLNSMTDMYFVGPSGPDWLIVDMLTTSTGMAE